MTARLSLPTALGIAVLTGAAAFAAGRSSTSAPAGEPTAMAASSATLASATEFPESLPPGHPSVGEADVPAPAAAAAAAAESTLRWVRPARWQEVPNKSPMRLATFRIPHAPEDTRDAELSVMQAGGTTEANAKRWIAQFEGAVSKQTTRKVAGFEVTVVEVSGRYRGAGMGNDEVDEPGWALVGVIVATPGLPHFFKMVGPARSVTAARAELDAMIASLGSR